MSCVYPPSQNFSVVPSEDVNNGRIPGVVKGPQISQVGESACTTRYASLAQRLQQDILRAYNNSFAGIEMPQFIVLAHKWEYDHPDFTIADHLKHYVDFRDVSLGYPLAINAWLYITDLAAFGLPADLSETDVLNSVLRTSTRITYIVANTDLENG